jgi:hypothetical protein
MEISKEKTTAQTRNIRIWEDNIIVEKWSMICGISWLTVWFHL